MCSVLLRVMIYGDEFQLNSWDELSFSIISDLHYS